MKAMRFNKSARSLSFSASILLASVSGGVAQTSASNSIPLVTVQATQPFAVAANPGVFTVFRAGNTDATLNVWYDLGGTASNGVDYAMIPPHLVQIPAGAISNTIVILPLLPTNSVPLSFIKSVVLKLTNSPLMTPVNYQIGSPSRAMVYLENTNFGPPVAITMPANGATFYTPTNIFIGASVSYVGYPFPTNLEFFAGTNDLGKGIFGLSSGFGGSAFLTWSNPPPGGYALTAVASYNNFLFATSAPVNITVSQGPATNLPPAISIVSPVSGAMFSAPANIPLLARASDADDAVTNVEFFAGTNDLGRGLPVVLDPPGMNGIVGPVYFLNWTNVPIGNYSVTAAATDASGLRTVSAAVNLTVQTATNRPPFVRITSPPNDAVFRAPVNIPIYAFAADPDGMVTSVEFFAAGSSLGLGHRVNAVPPPLLPGGIQPPILFAISNYWQLIWTNPPLATNIALTAAATDNGGLTAISQPENISILPSLPPPTNRPAFVSIVATDPVAIEGTNCWRWPVRTNWFLSATPGRFITNCGPKNATFTVFRRGATNNDLTVNYLVGGTASNGVDYVALPGAASIPAGQRQAEISIVPLDDGPPDVTSTVVLHLAPGTNYFIGTPANAAAMILDSQTPQSTTGVLPGNLFHLNASGPDGAWFHVEYTSDLIHWTPICTNQVVNGGIDFIDPDAGNQPARYYRTVPEAGPPQ